MLHKLYLDLHAFLLEYKLHLTDELYNLCLLYTSLPKNLIKHNNKQSFLDRFKVVDYDKPSHTMVAHISKDGHHYICLLYTSTSLYL